MKRDAWYGITTSFTNAFKPSANGCNKPQIPTTFGPRRRWILAIIFRSANVKNAIATNNGIIVKKDKQIL